MLLTKRVLANRSCGLRKLTNLLGDDGGQSTEQVALAVNDNGLSGEGRHLQAEKSDSERDCG